MSAGLISSQGGGGGGGVAIGGAVTGGTVGSVLFVGAGALVAQDNAKLFWDDTADRLGVGTATPGVFGITFGAQPDTIAHFTRVGVASNTFLLLEAGTAKDTGISFFTDTINEDASIFLDESDARKLKVAVGIVATDATRLTATKLTLQQDGKFGVGTTAPVDPLHIKFSAAGLNSLRLENTSATGFSSTVFINHTATYKGGIGHSNASNQNYWDNATGTLTVITGDHATDNILSIRNTVATGYSGISYFKSDSTFQTSLGFGNATAGIIHLRGNGFWFSGAPNLVLANATQNEITFGMTTGSTFMQMQNGSGAAVSAASTARLRYNSGTDKLQVSKNGAAYVDII
jgi:hypothetical protein